MPEAITVREALRLLWEADCYPRIGNHDWVVGAAMEDEALAKAEFAILASDDPPKFPVWLTALRKPNLSVNEREEIYRAIHDYFGEGDPGSLAE
jgi:hypothetical protein